MIDGQHRWQSIGFGIEETAHHALDNESILFGIHSVEDMHLLIGRTQGFKHEKFFELFHTGRRNKVWGGNVRTRFEFVQGLFHSTGIGGGGLSVFLYRR